jgi:PhnB protein
MTTANIYLTFDGNCLAAFDFYRSVFGGTFDYVGTFGDMPPQEGLPPMSEHVKKQIMHISLPISKETILMGSDKGEWTPPLVVGNNFSISVLVDTTEEADRIFKGLSSGGKVIMPLGKQFWGAYYGMLCDQFGVQWMLNCDIKE